MDTLSRKEEYHEKSFTKIQYVWTIFVGKNSLEKISYLANPSMQHYFMELQAKTKSGA
jgi:hypothetical protein